MKPSTTSPPCTPIIIMPSPALVSVPAGGRARRESGQSPSGKSRHRRLHSMYRFRISMIINEIPATSPIGLDPSPPRPTRDAYLSGMVRFQSSFAAKSHNCSHIPSEIAPAAVFFEKVRRKTARAGSGGMAVGVRINQLAFTREEDDESERAKVRKWSCEHANCACDTTGTHRTQAP